MYELMPAPKGTILLVSQSFELAKKGIELDVKFLIFILKSNAKKYKIIAHNGICLAFGYDTSCHKIFCSKSQKRRNPFTLKNSMPSPPIPRSKSAPDIGSPQSPSRASNSVRTTRSTGSPIIVWPKKLGDLITRKAKNPHLTEESLQEFNRRNAEARHNTSSPYYKGLTDFSLVINREKLSGSSPGRESHAGSFISSGSKSSFVVKVQEWGSSCFTSKKHEKSSSSLSSTWTKSSQDGRTRTSSSSSSSQMKFKETGETVAKIKTKVSANYRNKVTFGTSESEENLCLPTTEKPLRERDLEPSMLPLPPPTAQPEESLPYPQPQIILPTAQPLPSTPEASSQPIADASLSRTPVGEGLTDEIQKKGNERKYVWADRYRPLWLQDFLCNRETARSLQATVRKWGNKSEECSHFIFEGNPGVGKRTMIWAFLREAFGAEKVQAREECKVFHLKGEAVSSVLVNLKVSPQHIEVDLSELKGYEKHVIAELIQEKNQKVPITTLQNNRENCKAIILNDADKLSIDALSYIKWMLEKFKGCNKVFFCCRDSAKLDPVKPICTLVQLFEPSDEEILAVLAFIAKQEGIQLPQKLANQMAKNSKNNLRQAIRSFEATWHCSSPLKEDQDIKTGWEDKIADIARNVIEEQSPKQLYNIRGELQNLIEHNVDPGYLFQNIVEELKKNLPDQLEEQFDNLYNGYQKNQAIKKYLAPENHQEVEGKRHDDPRKNVQQFMRIEGSISLVALFLIFRVYSKIHELHRIKPIPTALKVDFDDDDDFKHIIKQANLNSMKC
ncbi:uncharacterized protein [Henckelia pumila]|uniref:uncharacterized protein n=1 Tax=Henckelia pumila TaxID=405737 RepID=UPI003C6E011E